MIDAPGPDETLDRLSATLRILQRRRGHRAASDDTLLAWFALQARPAARRVLDLGTGKGTVALLLLRALPDCVVVGVEAVPEAHALAVRNARLNGLVQRFSPRLGDLRDAAAQAGAQVLIADDEFAEMAVGAVTAVERPMIRPGALPEARRLAPVPLDDGALAYLGISPLDGGTRLVPVTYEALRQATLRLVHHWSARRGDLVCTWLPLDAHNALIAGLLLPDLFGLRTAALDTASFVFNPALWLWTMHGYRATITVAPSRAYDVCARHLLAADLGGLDLKALRLAFVGADRIHPDHLWRFVAHFASHGLRRDALVPFYGGIETIGGCTFPVPGEMAVVDSIDAEHLSRSGEARPVRAAQSTLHLVALGRPLPGTELQVVDKAGRVRPPRVLGELQVRGEGIIGSAEAADGWLDTGDVGYLADDRLFVLGRRQQLLRIGNRTWHVLDIEVRIDRL
ncbi:MAG: AMP-binding protein, partial [Myxococcales bacterium]|nr:AMP-binding protein [Myxococcales bacterium]